MKIIRRWFFTFLALLVAQTALLAQISYSGGTYTQDFNTLPTSATTTTVLPNTNGNGPFDLTAAPFNASGMSGWSFAKYAGSGAGAVFIANNGSGNGGAAYSYGAPSATERALGSLASGTVIPRFGVAFTNSTGSTITEFTLSYTGEQWRHGGATVANKLTFAYTVGTALEVNINTGTFVNTSSLDFTGLVVTTTAGALDGNTTYRTPISATVTGLTWAAGDTLILRWSDVDDGGSDDGLAVDDLTFTTPVGSGGASPAISAVNPAAGAVNVSPATNVVVDFNMPVTVTGTWFSLVGSSSGVHDATVMGAPVSYTLVPTAPFSEGETVTLTVFAAQVTDAATGTKQPAADFVSTFTTLSTTPLPIHTIQGSGSTSAYVGQVQSIEGVVTASFQGAGGLGGFYVQAPEADYDADATTSEGIFVFNNVFSVSVGDVVKVTGKVAEFGSPTSTQTELTDVTFVTKLGTATLPASTAVTLPFASLTYAERYEGMRVTLPQTLTVTDNFDLGHFGEIILSNGRLSTPTNIVAPGATANAQSVANFLNQILVDDARGNTYPDPTPFLVDSAGRGLTRRAGSTTSDVTGIFDEKFGSYIIEPTATLTFTDANPRANAPVVGGTLKVAIGNVLNFFNGDGAGAGFPTSRGADSLAEYQRQRDKIIAGILGVSSDIMGLTEVENDRITNGLPDSYGAASAIADLVNGLNAAAPAGTTYAYINAAGIDIVSDEIHCAFIYRVETVLPVGLPAMLNSPYFNGLARNPLAQTFQEISSGQKLTVCINHFKSKGSASTSAASTDGIIPNPNLDQGDGQGSSNYVRKRQAAVLVQWLATDPTGSGDPDFLIIGDLNAYAKEDPIVILEDAGYINLTESSEGPGGYSYAFNAEFGHLDHALANCHLAEQVVEAQTWHVNSDEPVYYDYNVENKNAAQQAVNVGGAYRYSDHDPVVVGLNLHPEYAAPFFTQQPESQTVVIGASVTFTAVADGYPAPTIKWQKNGNDVPNATGGSLTLNAVTMSDAGTYTAIATNSISSTGSNPATLVVQDVTAPVLTLPASQTLEATSPNGAIATFSATALDNVDGSVAVSLVPASGSMFPLGTTTVNATATDSSNNTATGSFTITVHDTTAPVISSLTASPNSLGSANHKMIAVKLTAVVQDARDATPTTKIISVTSNESVNGSNDGNTSNDWVVTGPLTLNLRAERSGTSAGRIYTITVESRDDSNNVTTRTVTVTVPKNG